MVARRGLDDLEFEVGLQRLHDHLFDSGRDRARTRVRYEQDPFHDGPCYGGRGIASNATWRRAQTIANRARLGQVSLRGSVRQLSDSCQTGRCGTYEPRDFPKALIGCAGEPSLDLAHRVVDRVAQREEPERLPGSTVDAPLRLPHDLDAQLVAAPGLVEVADAPGPEATPGSPRVVGQGVVAVAPVPEVLGREGPRVDPG